MKLSCPQRASASLISCQRSGCGGACSGITAGAGAGTGGADGSGSASGARGAFAAARRVCVTADLAGEAGFEADGGDDDFLGGAGAGADATLAAGGVAALRDGDGAALGTAGAGGAASGTGAVTVVDAGGGDGASGRVDSVTTSRVAGGEDGSGSADLIAGVDVAVRASIQEVPSVVATR